MKAQKKLLNSTVIGVLIFGYIGMLPFLAHYNLVPSILRTQLIGYVGDAFLAFGALYSIRTFRGQNKLALVLFGALMVMMLVKSFNEESHVEYFVGEDTRLYLRFFFMFWIGYQWADFQRIRKAMMIIMGLGIVMNLISLASVSTLLRAFLSEKPLVYQIQYLLIPSSFYLLLYKELTRREKIIVVTAFTLYALEQILFQKRLPTARIALTLFAFYYSATLMNRNLGSTMIETIKKAISGLGLLGFSTIILLILGFNIGIYFTALIDRFTGTGGDVTETVENDERWRIGEVFYEDLIESGEILTGRGFGGVVYHGTFQMKDDSNQGFRPSAEMGIPTMVLKGGVLLVVFFAVILLIVLRRFRLFTENSYSFAIWAHSFIWFVFLYAEGFIVNINSPDEMLVAYCLGACIAKKSFVLIKSRQYQGYEA